MSVDVEKKPSFFGENMPRKVETFLKRIYTASVRFKKKRYSKLYVEGRESELEKELKVADQLKSAAFILMIYQHKLTREDWQLVQSFIPLLRDLCSTYGWMSEVCVLAVRNEKILTELVSKFLITSLPRNSI